MTLPSTCYGPSLSLSMWNLPRPCEICLPGAVTRGHVSSGGGGRRILLWWPPSPNDKVTPVTEERRDLEAAVNKSDTLMRQRWQWCRSLVTGADTGADYSASRSREQGLRPTVAVSKTRRPVLRILRLSSINQPYVEAFYHSRFKVYKLRAKPNLSKA